MKIIIGRLGHETNTFSSETCTFEMWSRMGWFVGDELFKAFKGNTDYVSGMMDAAEAEGVEVIPTISMLDAGPLIPKAVLDKAMGKLLQMIEDNKDGVDGICLALHGGGCAEGIDDLETYTLREVRKIVGKDMPITITLDLHANMTQDMLDECQGIFGIKECPHIDYYPAGVLAMKSLIHIIRTGKPLYMSLVKLPMLMTNTGGNTISGLAKPFKEMFAAYKTEQGLLDATMFHGFSYADRSITGASALAVSEKSQQHADDCARELAKRMWNGRFELMGDVLSAKAAVDKAAAILALPGEGYVVVNETSDNPGGGTTCDATGLLRELLNRQEYHSILAYMHDPEIALMAHKAGVGAHICGLLGGKKDHLHGEPIELKDAYVAGLSDGIGIRNTPALLNQVVSYGKMARLIIGNCEVVVTELCAQQTFDDIPFLLVGADLHRYDIVGVKSSNHFRGWFEPRCKATVAANEAGILTDNLSLLPYKNVKRPIFPLDMDTEFNL